MNKKIQIAAISGAILFSIFVLTSSDNETSIPLPKPNSYSENDAVSLILSNQADVSFGLKSEAKKFELDFIPIVTERFDLIVYRKYWSLES